MSSLEALFCHVDDFCASFEPRWHSKLCFVEWLPSTLIPLCVYLKHCFGLCTGISFLDATKVQVCHNRRIASHRVFENLAARGKTSGDLLNVHITPGNTDDRQPVPQLLQSLFGKVFADRGYVSQV